MRRAGIGTIERPRGALDDVAVFVAVARQASFIAASRRLGVPTSSVSRSIARLEEDLGVQLLRRTSRKVTVTDEGRELLLAAAPHVEGLEEALALTTDLRAEPTGTVRVTAPTYTGSTWLTRALAAFAAAHPRISIELDASNAIRDLLRDGFDFAIRVGAWVQGDFVARRLWKGEFGLFASHDFVRASLRGRSIVRREDIERGPCVVPQASGSWRFIDAKGRPLEVSPQARFAINDPRAVLEAARAGLGIALSPVEAFAADPRGLTALQADFGQPEPRDLYVVYPTRKLLPRRVRMAIDWLIASPRPSPLPSKG